MNSTDSQPKLVSPLGIQTEFTFPRKKHSHRCPICGQGVYCYKTRCTKPQRCVCSFCRR